MTRQTEITKKLKGADPEIKMYIVELERENLRLHKKIAKLLAENTTKDNEISALKKQIGKPSTFRVVYDSKPSQKE